MDKAKLIERLLDLHKRHLVRLVSMREWTHEQVLESQVLDELKNLLEEAEKNYEEKN